MLIVPMVADAIRANRRHGIELQWEDTAKKSRAERNLSSSHYLVDKSAMSRTLETESVLRMFRSSFECFPWPLNWSDDNCTLGARFNAVNRASSPRQVHSAASSLQQLGRTELKFRLLGIEQ